jgi:hypothetical protein
VRLAVPFLPMVTQVYFRNPKNYARELVASGATRSTWDEGFCTKYKIDPSKYLSMFYPENVEWEAIVIGWSGARVLDRDHNLSNPREVHHVWSVEGNIKAGISEFFARLRAENFTKILVVTDMPNVASDAGKKLLLDLAEHCDQNPEAKILLHGSYSFNAMFQYGFWGADMDPRVVASKGKIVLPNGKEIDTRKGNPVDYLQWIHLMGFKVSELTEARDRCIFNIYSALWAGQFFETNFAFKSRKHKVDFDVSESEFTPAKSNRFKRVKHDFKDSDKLLCNTCTVQVSCKYFRLGAVCSVPGAEPAKLAEMFNTRNADLIIKGLGTVLATQANRAETAMADETLSGDLSPEVTKILNSLFNNGVKLAKLVNPDLNGKGVQVGIQLNGVATASIAAASSASQLTSSIVAKLEERGIPREDITPGMIAAVLADITDEREILELEGPVGE